MKRHIGIVVLFVLLIFTVASLVIVGTPADMKTNATPVRSVR